MCFEVITVSGDVSLCVGAQAGFHSHMLPYIDSFSREEAHMTLPASFSCGFWLFATFALRYLSFSKCYAKGCFSWNLAHWSTSSESVAVSLLSRRNIVQFSANLHIKFSFLVPIVCSDHLHTKEEDFKKWCRKEIFIEVLICKSKWT